MNTIVYNAFDNLYINLTNRCSNSCDFCIRSGKDSVYGADNLWLEHEPTAAEVIAELEKNKHLISAKEVVFCGFGEPTYRIDEIVEIAQFLKNKGKKTRINTNGQGSIINGYDISDKLIKSIDIINVSLNSATAKGYQNICHSEFGEQGFIAMLEFAKACAEKKGVNVIFSVVDNIGSEQIEECRELCNQMGIPLRIRAFED